jgi:ATP-dependent Clp protease ATP-binding subunit ClpA
VASLDNTSHDQVAALVLRSIAIAQAHQHEIICTNHMLAALLETGEVERCLTKLGVDVSALQIGVQTALTAQPRGNQTPTRTREFDIIIGRTLAYAQFNPRRMPTGLDVLVQMMQLPSEDSYAISQLSAAGVTSYKLKRYIANYHQRSRVDSPENSETEPSNREEAISYISKYCTNLNELATNGKIDPVIARDYEIDRITQIMARRRKNNIALVGEVGIGKTAIVEGLAYGIEKRTVSPTLHNATIWSLDVGSLVAGTRYRGDFEERMKFLLKAFTLIEDCEPILFIDEIHTIIEAGSGNRGSLDASNLLKPALARGKLRCIGSTTEKDWRQHFEKDRALLRRFKKLLIDEPSIDDAKRIVHGLAGVYGAFHGVYYSDDALDAAVVLTARYVHDARLPDKAFDIIDDAGARHRINGDVSLILRREDIEAEVARMTQIPVQHLDQDESDRLIHLENTLLGTVFGQDEAVKLLVDTVMIGRAGLSSPNQPEGCFLFVGPTGVGKSELGRQLAKALRIPLLKYDMSEYMEKHAVSKLIGAPPGYVGYGEGDAGDGLLINAIERTPACVLMLDEVEKAHPDLLNILLQVMEDGKLTNSAGKSVSFHSVILIMTSNLGVASTEQSVGFMPFDTPEIDMRAVRNAFSPEFRNRLDAIVNFKPLDTLSIGRVVDKFIDELQEMVVDRHIIINLHASAQHWLTTHGYDPVYGARPLARLIREKIKRALSRLILFGELKHGGTATVEVVGNELLVHGNATPPEDQPKQLMNHELT